MICEICQKDKYAQHFSKTNPTKCRACVIQKSLRYKRIDDAKRKCYCGRKIKGHARCKDCTALLHTKKEARSVFSMRSTTNKDYCVECALKLKEI